MSSCASVSLWDGPRPSLSTGPAAEPVPGRGVSGVLGGGREARWGADAEVAAAKGGGAAACSGRGSGCAGASAGVKVGRLHAVGVCAGSGVGYGRVAGVTACALSAWKGGSVVAGVTRWCLPVLGLCPKCPPREATACRTCTPPLGGVATGEHAAPPPPGRCCMATAARRWTGREPPL